MSAANCPTACLSQPEILTIVGLARVHSTPSGNTNRTVLENPTLRFRTLPSRIACRRAGSLSVDSDRHRPRYRPLDGDPATIRPWGPSPEPRSHQRRPRRRKESGSAVFQCETSSSPWVACEKKEKGERKRVVCLEGSAYQISQSTSPPTPFDFASRLLSTPWLVEITEIPSPCNTSSLSRLRA